MLPGRIIAVALALAVAALAAKPSHRAEWLGQARFGVFVHYLAESATLPPEEWNRRIDSFDAEGLAAQLASAGARYFVLTLGQNSGHYLAPNQSYERFTRTGKCARRDLVADVAKALARRGIRLMVYLPSGAPDQDPAAMARLEWTRGAFPNTAFERRWEQVIAEWSERWGAAVSGWWFDGCYWPNTMYRSAVPPNFASFAAAARKGNPASIVAFNRGVVVPIHAESEQEDYTAGEIDDPVSAAFAGTDVAQPHMLSYLGTRWSGGPPRFDTAQAVAITLRLNKLGGAVTWDVPTRRDGLIAAPFLDQLRAIGKAVAATP
jgi:hypothetical protein